MSNYSEHEKLQKMQNELQAVGDFIEWLREREYRIAFYDNLDMLQPQFRTTEAWLADWKQIDLIKLEEEKCHMLKSIRALTDVSDNF